MRKAVTRAVSRVGKLSTLDVDQECRNTASDAAAGFVQALAFEGGSVTVLACGFGNCRISSTAARHDWRGLHCRGHVLNSAVSEPRASATGRQVETGALARHQYQPLLRALMVHDPSRCCARLVARLHEMALLLLDAHTVSLGTVPLATGQALAWVENARGLLVHQVQLDERGQQVLSYRIVAPTEWNFRPGGPLVLSLAEAAVADAAAAQDLAMRLVHSLDPCVACHIEIAHA